MSKIDRSDKNLIVKDNNLIGARYGLTLNEKRLILLGMTKINSTVFPDRNKPLNFTITTDDWMVAFPYCKNPYKEMRRACENLAQKSVKFKPRDGEVEERIVLWCDSVEFYRGRASIKLQFGYTISLYLQGMTEQFTTLKASWLWPLKSINAIMVCEMIMQWISTGYCIKSLEDFRYCTDTVDKYPEWANLKRFVIDKAVKEINEKTPLNVTFKAKKIGKKVAAVEFFFSEDPVPPENKLT